MMLDLIMYALAAIAFMTIIGGATLYIMDVFGNL